MIAEAADKADVFAQPHVWKGTKEQFTSLSQCVARLRSLTQLSVFIPCKFGGEAGVVAICIRRFLDRELSLDADIGTLNRLLNMLVNERVD